MAQEKVETKVDMNANNIPVCASVPPIKTMSSEPLGFEFRN